MTGSPLSRQHCGRSNTRSPSSTCQARPRWTCRTWARRGVPTSTCSPALRSRETTPPGVCIYVSYGPLHIGGNYSCPYFTDTSVLLTGSTPSSSVLPRQAKRRQAGRRTEGRGAGVSGRQARFARVRGQGRPPELADGRPRARRGAPDGREGGAGTAPPAQSQADLRPRCRRRRCRHRRRHRCRHRRQHHRRRRCLRRHARRRRPRHPCHALYALHSGQSPCCRRRRRRRWSLLLRSPNARGRRWPARGRRLLAALFRPELPREISTRCIGRFIEANARRHAGGVIEQPRRFAAMRWPLAAVFRPGVALLRTRRHARHRYAPPPIQP